MQKRRSRNVTTETDFGVLQLHLFKKGWQQPKPGRGKEISSSTASRVSDVRTVKELISNFKPTGL